MFLIYKELDMNTDQNPAVERLLKKIAALRATLPTDEREVLDQFIPVDEVSAHAMKKGVVRAAKRAAKRTAEVKAHAMKKGVVRAAKRAAKKSPEVAAHAMKKGATPAAKKAAKKSPEAAAR
jgi:hypothetical protein